MEEFERARPGRGLVRGLIDRGIRDRRVLAAFDRVPRALFVPEELRGEAEADHPLAIGCGQTISQPYVVALMLAALELHGDERVLEIGTGSGYLTALLCEMLSATAQLRTIEVLPELSHRAERTLLGLGYQNIEHRLGDGALGWPEAAPYQAIIASAAPAKVPPALLEQLAPGGRLLLPVGASADRQVLELWRRVPATGALERRVLLQVRFVPLIEVLH